MHSLTRDIIMCAMLAAISWVWGYREGFERAHDLVKSNAATARESQKMARHCIDTVNEFLGDKN